MNRLTVLVACAMFALGAVAGHTFTAPATVDASTLSVPMSPFDLMRNARDLPVQTVTDAV